MQLHHKVIYLSVLLFFTPAYAFAFERDSVGGDPAANVSSHEVGEIKKKEAAELSGASSKKLPEQDPGVPINIPGLGTLGVIPKLDFGMELLYGNENKQNIETAPEVDDESLQIRGTIKHRF